MRLESLLLGALLVAGCSIFDPPPESTDQRDRIAPARVVDLKVASVTRVSANVAGICLTWTAPGDDGDQGLAKGYEFGYSPELIEILSWDTEGIPPGWGFWRTPDPKPAGNMERRCWNLRVPADRLPFYVALRCEDDVGNWSSLSNVAVIR